MKKLKLLVPLIAGAAFATGFVACGGDDDSDGSRTPGASATATRTAAASAAGTVKATASASATANRGADGEYYSQLEDIVNEADQQTAVIAGKYDGPYNNTADEIDQTTSAFNETGQVFESTLLALSDLEPPAEAAIAHQDYFDSVQAATILFADVSAALDGVTSDADLTAFKNQYGSQLNGASADIEEKCLVLQGLADSAGSAADLGCSVQN